MLERGKTVQVIDVPYQHQVLGRCKHWTRAYDPTSILCCYGTRRGALETGFVGRSWHSAAVSFVHCMQRCARLLPSCIRVCVHSSSPACPMHHVLLLREPPACGDGCSKIKIMRMLMHATRGVAAGIRGGPDSVSRFKQFSDHPSTAALHHRSVSESDDASQAASAKHLSARARATGARAPPHRDHAPRSVTSQGSNSTDAWVEDSLQARRAIATGAAQHTARSTL